MTLADFINRHAGETAWLFGKGPSLTTFDFQTAGPLRVAINDVIAHVPHCVYGFANDGVARWIDAYKPGQVLFQPRRCLHEYDSTAPGAVACDVVAYADDSDDRRLVLPRERLAECLTIRRGTLGSALQILHIMGVREIHMVGIDGGGTHAPGIEWKTRLRHDHAKDYDAIRSAAIDAAFLMGITLKFHNHDHTMQNDGKIFVRMLRNCFVGGNPYPLGEVAAFSPKVAHELVSNRSAEHFAAPTERPLDRPPVETAESRIMTAAENTTIATTKGKGRK
jgi:hypothetical protein